MLECEDAIEAAGVESGFCVILCDIGNSRAHLYERGNVVDLSIDECFERYGKKRVHYICVNDRVKRDIPKKAPKWIDVSRFRMLETSYKGLGIDREAACLGVEDGIVVDAGSAITVDLMENGVHKGGWIWPGISAMKSAYAKISSRLDCEIVTDLDFGNLPQDTCSAVSFGVLAPIETLVERFGEGKRVIVTGGDAEKIASILPGAQVDKEVVFKGMKKMIKENEC